MSKTKFSLSCQIESPIFRNPLWVFSKPANALNKLVLPEPEGPKITVTPLSGILKLASRMKLSNSIFILHSITNYSSL